MQILPINEGPRAPVSLALVVKLGHGLTAQALDNAF